MTSESELYTELVPEPSILRRYAVLSLASVRTHASALSGEDPESPVAEQIGCAAEAWEGLATRALERLGDETPVSDGVFERLLAELWETTRGRSPQEQLLTLHLNAGLLEDVCRHLATGHGEDGAAEVDELLNWQDAQADLIAALKGLFERDTHIDDRLAMWGRRIAGDQAVWARRVIGIEPGQSVDEVVPGAHPIEAAFVKQIFAQHSRRMNELALAA